MQQDQMDELDIRLVNVLQIAPRISWAEAGTVLDLSPSAVAERWRRLRDSGLTWISVYPSDMGHQHITATVDVDCRLAQRKAVAQQLCLDPRVVSLDECARGRDLLLTVMVPDLPTLSRFVLDELTAIPGITDTRTSVATAVHRTGSDWRLDALDADQRRRAEAIASGLPSPQREPAPLPPDVWPLIDALTPDGRRSIADLARATGRTPATVRRQLLQLLASNALTFRCDFEHAAAGWPISFTWFARVPPVELPRTLEVLTGLPQLRMCLSTTGQANLVFSVFSRSVAGLARFEQILGQKVPRLELIESMLHLRSLKRMGWLLDDKGRRTETLIVPNALQRTVASPEDPGD